MRQPQDQLWRHVFFITFTLHDTDPTTTHASLGTPHQLLSPPGTYDEAVYSTASRLLNGQPPTAAEEIGGFSLTIVLTFETPEMFAFTVSPRQKVRVGKVKVE